MIRPKVRSRAKISLKVETVKVYAPSFMIDRRLQCKTIISTSFLSFRVRDTDTRGQCLHVTYSKVSAAVFPSNLYTMDVFNGGCSHFFYIYQRSVPRNRKSIKTSRLKRR